MWISLYLANSSDPGYLPRNVPEYDMAIKQVCYPYDSREPLLYCVLVIMGDAVVRILVTGSEGPGARTACTWNFSRTLSLASEWVRGSLRAWEGEGVEGDERPGVPPPLYRYQHKLNIVTSHLTHTIDGTRFNHTATAPPRRLVAIHNLTIDDFF